MFVYGNYTDLCDDADAIGIATLLKKKTDSTHTLSSTLREYYTHITEKERYLLYQQDGLDISSFDKLYQSVYQKMDGQLEKLDFGDKISFKYLKGNSTVAEQRMACKAFANYLWHKIK